MPALYTDLKFPLICLNHKQNFHLQCPPLLSNLSLHAVEVFNCSTALQLVYFMAFLLLSGEFSFSCECLIFLPFSLFFFFSLTFGCHSSQNLQCKFFQEHIVYVNANSYHTIGFSVDMLIL